MDSFVTDASQNLEDVIKNDELSITLKHIRPRRRSRDLEETLISADFPGSKQKFSVHLDRATKRGKHFYG